MAEKNLIIIVDGMDGAGKSTLVLELRRLGYDVLDRGNATHMVDDDDLVAEPNAFYIILLAAVATCRQRLANASKPLDEWCHSEESLTHYRERYRTIEPRLPRAIYVDSDGSHAETMKIVLDLLDANQVYPVRPLGGNDGLR
ncbi:MAG: hypothetical protein V1738_03495 [Patescibacteria group bacterium]